MPMRLLLVAACLAGWPVAAFAQTPASLAGTIVGPDGAPFAEAPIQIRESTTRSVAGRTMSSPEGSYFVADLPPGSYILSIAMPCCAIRPFVSDPIVLSPAQARQFDVQLEEGVSLNTLGDDPATIAAELRDRQVVPDRPVPRMPDGRPDLSGVWLISEDPFPAEPRALPWAEELSRERIASDFRDHPHTRCLPAAPPVPTGATPGMGKFVQTSDLLVILFEDVPGFRQVFLDGRDHPANPNPSWMGHSIGRWEGDTLIVDTIGFNDRGWMGSYPRTEMMRMTERYRRATFGQLVVEVTIDDPGVFEEPSTQSMTWDLAPQEELIEYVCENNKWATPVD